MAATNISTQTVPAVTIVKKMRDYSKDPFFVKKKQMAMELIEKYGLPNGAKKKNKLNQQNSNKRSRIS